MDILKGLFDPKKRASNQHSQRGKHLAAVGELDRAIDLFTQAISLTPKDGELYFNRGLTFLIKTDAGSCLSDLQVALRFSPNNPEAYGVVATAYSMSGNELMAYAHYQAVLEFGRPKMAVEMAENRSQELKYVLTTDWEQAWLKACQSKYEAVITDHRKKFESVEQIRQGGSKALDSVMGLVTNKYREWAKEYTENAYAFSKKKYWRSAIAQLMESIQLSPLDHEAEIVMVATGHFMLGQYARCLRFLSLVNGIEFIPEAVEIRERATRFMTKYGDIRKV